MKKLLHPTYGILIIELLVFLAAVDVILLVSSSLSLQKNIPYNVCCGIFTLLYLIYLLYVLIDFALRLLKPYGTLKELIYKYFHVSDLSKSKLGYSGAASVLLFFITLALGCIAFYMTRDKDEIAKKKQRKKNEKQLKQQNKQFGGFSV